MPLSWNTVNTHTAGDVLPLADWNQAATALNSMVGTWVTQGTLGNQAINGTPPLYAWAATITVTTNSTGTASVTIPNGGFPNGVICVPSSYSIPGATTSNTNQVYPTQSNSKTVLNWQCVNTTTGAALNAVTLNITFIAIGY